MIEAHTGSNKDSYAIGDLQIIPRGAVTMLEMNRPDKLNAMTYSFWGDLRDALTQLENDGRTRALVITGAGERAFSAGGDIESFAELKTIVDKRNFQAETMETFMKLENSSLPVIAAVNGYALGGGCELTFACDVVLASDRAVFGMPESSLGLVPGYGVLRAPDVIGRQMTKLLVMAAEQIDAHEALQCGLVQRVVVHERLLTQAVALAEKIAANSPLAHAIGKRIINRGRERSEFDYSVEALTVLQASDDTQEGIRAFIEKRKPVFPGLG